MRANYHDEPKTTQPDVERNPVSIEMLHFAKSLADLATTIADRTHIKLSPVMVSATPTCDGGCTTEKEREWPPLFADLRGQFLVISTALSAIDDALDRTEL